MYSAICIEAEPPPVANVSPFFRALAALNLAPMPTFCLFEQYVPDYSPGAFWETSHTGHARPSDQPMMS